MGSKKQTTVNLTTKGRELKKKYKGFNLKGLLTVGLELFDKLPAQEKIEQIRKVLDNDEKPQKRRKKRTSIP